MLEREDRNRTDAIGERPMSGSADESGRGSGEQTARRWVGRVALIDPAYGWRWRSAAPARKARPGGD